VVEETSVPSAECFSRPKAGGVKLSLYLHHFNRPKWAKSV